MGLIKRWNEYLGPKDERLEAEECKQARVGALILLIGAIISLYYGIALDQVASTTGHPLQTELGARVVPMQLPLIATILVAGVVTVRMQIRSGSFSSRKRYAEVDSVPWGDVTLLAVGCGAIVAVLVCGMRIIAEAQIVGFDGIAWFGDIAMGVVFFGMGFALGFVAFAASIHDAIKRRRELEREWMDE